MPQTFASFQEQLRTHDEYRTTAPAARSWLPTVSYYSRFLLELLRGTYGCRHGYTYRVVEYGSWQMIRHCEAVGATVRIAGLQHARQLGCTPVVVANHMSTLETMALPAILSPFTPVSYILKQSLLHYPLLGRFLREMQAVTVTRKHARDDFAAVLDQGVKTLAGKVAIVVFPQSSRTTTFIPKRFNTIGVRLAKAAGVPVLPLAVKTDFWGNGRLIKDLGWVDPRRDVYFEFGAPFLVDDLRAGNQRLIEFIADRLTAWQALATAARPPPA